MNVSFCVPADLSQRPGRLTTRIPADPPGAPPPPPPPPRAPGLFVIPGFSFDPAAPRGSGDFCHHPRWKTNSGLLSGDFFSMFFLSFFFSSSKEPSSCLRTIISFQPLLGQTSKKIHIICWGERETVASARQWAGEHSSVALLAHLGSRMTSFPIKIIGLDMKQDGFDIRFVQKYESNYNLRWSGGLLEKENIAFSRDRLLSCCCSLISSAY